MNCSSYARVAGMCGLVAVVGASAGCPSAADDPFSVSPSSVPSTSGTPTDDGDDDGSKITADAVGTVDSTAADTASATSGPDAGTSTTGGPDGSGTDATGGDACTPACGADEECVAGTCEPIGGSASSGGPPVCHDVAGGYADCLGPGDAVNANLCGAGGHTCLTGGTPAIAGVCSIDGCTDACDCPAAPPTGTAPVACDTVTGGTDTFCFLDCAAGQTCPDGMTCFGGTVCIWPGEGAEPEPWGDCLTGGTGVCGLEGLCLNDDVATPTIGVCTIPCAGVGDCWPSPGGTAPAACNDVTGDGAAECILDCSAGGTCPAGMSCFASTLCAWM